MEVERESQGRRRKRSDEAPFLELFHFFFLAFESFSVAFSGL